MSAATDHLAAARLWAATAAPYLATALFAMTPVPIPGYGTLGVDRGWRLYVDHDTAARWSVEELGTVLIHEVHHLLRNHGERAEALRVRSASHRRFNVAADCEINDDLTDLSLPGGAVFPDRFGLSRNELAETYFALLPPLELDHWPDCGSGADGLRRDWELEGPNAGSLSELEADLVRQQTAIEIRQVLQAGGRVAGGLERWARAFLHPKVDWRVELGALVRWGVETVAGRVDYSYGRPSRRTGTPIGRAVVLPALVQSVARLAVVVDTSASMSPATLEQALAEIRGILAAQQGPGTGLAVLSCDTAVQSAERVFSATQVHLPGGGGTDLRIGLAAALDLRPRPQVVIVVTDGLTPWPDRPPRLPTIVALIGDGPSAPNWARTVRIPQSAPKS